MRITPTRAPARQMLNSLVIAAVAAFGLVMAGTLAAAAADSDDSAAQAGQVNRPAKKLIAADSVSILFMIILLAISSYLHPQA